MSVQIRYSILLKSDKHYTSDKNKYMYSQTKFVINNICNFQSEIKPALDQFYEIGFC